MNYIKMKAPLNPPMGDFFRMSLCNVSLLPLYFSSDFSIRVLTCIIQHGQKANRVKMNGYAALSAFCPCCIFYARKPRQIKKSEEKYIERREKMYISTFEKLRASPPEASLRRFLGASAPANFKLIRRKYYVGQKNGNQ